MPLLPLTAITITARTEKGEARTIRAPQCREWSLNSEGMYGVVTLTAVVSGTLEEQIRVTKDDPDAEVKRLTDEVTDLRRRLAVSEEDRARLAARCRELASVSEAAP
jgi:hypothetical protein